jgi:hypothetical protein
MARSKFLRLLMNHKVVARTMKIVASRENIEPDSTADDIASYIVTSLPSTS